MLFCEIELKKLKIEQLMKEGYTASAKEHLRQAELFLSVQSEIMLEVDEANKISLNLG
jgi:hypothetical protein